jgi:hypothetical protein
MLIIENIYILVGGIVITFRLRLFFVNNLKYLWVVLKHMSNVFLSPILVMKIQFFFWKKTIHQGILQFFVSGLMTIVV